MCVCVCACVRGVCVCVCACMCVYVIVCVWLILLELPSLGRFVTVPPMPAIIPHYPPPPLDNKSTPYGNIVGCKFTYDVTGAVAYLAADFEGGGGGRG